MDKGTRDESVKSWDEIESLAVDVIRDAKRQATIWFAAWLVTLAALIGTNAAWIITAAR